MSITLFTIVFLSSVGVMSHGVLDLIMCGITGFFLTNLTAGLAFPEAKARLASMCSTIVHRGPDDLGIWTNGKAGLGHTRLSIIDLSALGHQPMSSPDNSIHVTFNGEIYNFLALRDELIALGHHFKSRSDTEVIVLGYLQWGETVFEKLRGMFAIGIFDERKEILVLARDRVGKKPLYYGWKDNHTFLFGSEIKALLAWPGFKREENLEAIHHYLSYQYVPCPLTAFQGIMQVQNGHIAVLDKKGHLSTKQYWKLPPPMAAKKMNENELKQTLIEKLNESVKIRMIADVPIGVLLSGGVDSSAVVAMMAQHASGKIKTFSIGFNEDQYDERHYARRIAERYETEHHELVLDSMAVDKILPKLVWHYGQPFADASAVPSFYVSEFARQHVKVVLTGDGSDENFLGYSRYDSCLALNTSGLYQWPDWQKHLLRRLINFLKPLSSRSSALTHRLMSFSKIIDTKKSECYAPCIHFFSDLDKEKAYAERLLPFIRHSSIRDLEPYFDVADSIVSGAAWADLHTYLVDDILVKMDVASMAYSLEARCPFLDQEIMDFAAQIPWQQKLLGGSLKGLLKSCLEPYLPNEVLYRKKMGFGLPIDEWFKKDLKEMTYDILLSSRMEKRGLIKASFIKKILDEHTQGIQLHHTRLWALLMLEQWYRMWIDTDNQYTQKLEKKVIYA